MQYSRAGLKVRFHVYLSPAYSVALNSPRTVTGRALTRVSIHATKQRAPDAYTICLLNARFLCVCGREWLGLHVCVIVDQDIPDTAFPFQVQVFFLLFLYQLRIL